MSLGSSSHTSIQITHVKVSVSEYEDVDGSVEDERADFLISMLLMADSLSFFSVWIELSFLFEFSLREQLLLNVAPVFSSLECFP